MEQEIVKLGSCSVRLYRVNTVVVGTGAAGYNAADRLAQYGQKDVVIVTERRAAGTSRNSGSDKQTYYKLTLAGSAPDSVRQMAQMLVQGGCTDGDTALCEAALSAQCFYRLAELGVPFPVTQYGETVGYKTDHDPCERGTSCGPYTSRRMTEVLEQSAAEKGIPVLSGMQCIRILRSEARCRGLLCLDQNAKTEAERYVVFSCTNVVFATGGPAGMYADSVYPLGHYGASGVAFEAGAVGKCLTEWQFGLSSIRPRWNVSGTFMQVVPRFISTSKDGDDQREFLLEYLEEEKLWETVFLKGYQWPFDVNKLANGSSLIDVLVYIETKFRGRRVFLDFRTNPNGRLLPRERMPDCCLEYLQRAGALFGTPVERLKHMNQPAVDFYRERGVDLEREPLEIALCAQHNNGGLAVNAWWETSLHGLFAAGEASGTHGVYRPGGTALNSGQVGSMRAAQYIAARRQAPPLTADRLLECCGRQITEWMELGSRILGDQDTAGTLWKEAAERMSRAASIVRDETELKDCLAVTEDILGHFPEKVRVCGPDGLAKGYRLHGMLLSQCVYLTAMLNYIRHGGKSRGSAVYTDADGSKPYPFLPECFRYKLDGGSGDGMVQELQYAAARDYRITWRKVRPLPAESAAFETIWRSYRENGNIPE